MSRQRKTTITVEQREITVLRRRRRVTQQWCDACAQQVEMLNPEQAAAVVSRSVRTIYRQIEAGQLHFSETPEGLVWVCLNSLLA
jgi:hypothetical protein